MKETVLDRLIVDLESFSGRYRRLFGRPENQEHSYKYLRGLVGPGKRKSVEPMAVEQFVGIRSLQRFISDATWRDEAIISEHQKHVNETLGENNAVLVVDSRGFPKKGKYSVGVARQYCGHVGKVENCQVGEFLVYRSLKGHTLVNRRLYVPKSWDSDTERLNRCQVPLHMHYKPSWELAYEMIMEATHNGLEYGWITGDEEFGRVPQLADMLHAVGKHYIFEVSAQRTWVWMEPAQRQIPAPGGKRGAQFRRPLLLSRKASHMAVSRAALRIAGDWTSYTVREATKGPIEVEAKRTMVWLSRRHEPDRPAWFIVTRTIENEPQYKYFLSECQWGTSLEKMLEAAYSRWAIEDCFKEANQDVGMGHYETRSWAGWHHHMTMVMLAHHFLAIERQKLGKKNARNYCQANRLLYEEITCVEKN